MVNTEKFASSVFAQLDYGLYWAGADNQFEKAGCNTKNGSTHYDPCKPTIIYIHGWQPSTVVRHYRESFYESGCGRPDIDFAKLWITTGYNIGIIYWNQLADEKQVKDAEAKIWSVDETEGIRWADNRGAYHYGEITQPVGELLFDNYTAAMANYVGDDIRLVGHSLGSQLAVRLAQLLCNSAKAGSIKSNLVAKRVSLLDAYFSNGSKNYLNGQWVGETVRNITDNLIAHDTAIDSYRTSAFTSSIFIGDRNNKLHHKLAFVKLSTRYFRFWQQTEKHVAAIWLYLWSIKYPPPLVANSPLSGISAAASNKLVKQWMDSNHYIKQQNSSKHKELALDNYKLITLLKLSSKIMTAIKIF